MTTNEELIAEARDMAIYARAQRHGAASHADMIDCLADRLAALATPQEGDARELAIQVALTHVPVLGVTGKVVGCQCMDRVFIQHQETWSEHIADALLAAFPALSLTASPDAVTAASSGKTLADEYLELLHDMQTKYVKDTDVLFLARKEAEAERDAATAALERVRAEAGYAALGENEPHNDWNLAMDYVSKRILAALDGAPELEWEYGNATENGFMYDMPSFAAAIENCASDTTVRRADGTVETCKRYVVRRRKAGPWEPVGGEN